jgi:hypothetical protein
MWVPKYHMLTEMPESPHEKDTTQRTLVRYIRVYAEKRIRDQQIPPRFCYTLQTKKEGFLVLILSSLS